jgi:3-oxoacyl-[acyl-carrier-protein] synthase II
VLLFADSTRPDRDVLVTGIGIVSPLGVSQKESWEKLIAGHRACRLLTPDDIDRHEQLSSLAGLRIAGAPVKHSEVAERLQSALAEFDHRCDSILSTIRSAASEPLIAMTLLAFCDAVRDAGLPIPLQLPDAACILGASKGGMRSMEQACHDLRGDVHRKSLPKETPEASKPGVSNEFSSWNRFQCDVPAQLVAALAGSMRSTSSPVAACATGLISLIQAAAEIHFRGADVCIAGSADAALRASVLASFHRLRVTSGHADPSTACRPFDETRNGFVVGEGAAVMILESRRHAESRGAVSYGRVTAGGWLSDPTGMTQIDATGSVVAELIRRVRAVLPPAPSARSVDYLNFHGTGTETNDLAEARGILAAFPDGYPACSGFKGSVGHLLGAAGSVESALTLMALRNGVIPGTVNHSVTDPRLLPLRPVSITQAADLRRVMKLSLGFGGHVAAGVFDRHH